MTMAMMMIMMLMMIVIIIIWLGLRRTEQVMYIVVLSSMYLRNWYLSVPHYLLFIFAYSEFSLIYTTLEVYSN